MAFISGGEKTWGGRIFWHMRNLNDHYIVQHNWVYPIFWNLHYRIISRDNQKIMATANNKTEIDSDLNLLIKRREELFKEKSDLIREVEKIRALIENKNLKTKTVDLDLNLYFEDALKILDINVESGLSKLRNILETILKKKYYEIENTEATKRMTIELYIIALRKKKMIKDTLYSHMQIVQRLGNKCAHSHSEKITIADFKAAFYALVKIVEWYLDDNDAKDN